MIEYRETGLKFNLNSEDKILIILLSNRDSVYSVEATI